MKKRRQKLDKTRDTARPSLNIYAYDNPVSNIPVNNRINAMSEMGKTSKASYEAALVELESLVLETHPLHLLCHFAMQLTSSNGLSSEWTEREPLLQHHVELLQAMLLRHPWENFKQNPIEFPRVEKLIKEVSKLFSLKRYSDLSTKQTNEERQSRSIRDVVRVHTQTVRNWGYPQHMQYLLVALLRPLDDSAHEKLGFTPSNLIKWFYTLVRVMENRIQNHISIYASILRSNSVPTLIRQHKKLLPDTPKFKASRSYLESVKSLNEAKMAVGAEAISMFTRLVLFKEEELVALFPVELTKDAKEKILGSISLQFGDLGDQVVGYFFMANPTWTKPLIRLEKDLFALPLPGLLISFGLEIAETLFTPHFLEKYRKRRAVFLEEETQRLFSLAFPTAQLFRGSIWNDPNDNEKMYENDVLLIMDSFAIVIECKSGRVSPTAKRGGDRLEHSAKELIAEPSFQGRRFIEFLMTRPGVHELETKSGAVNRIDTSTVHQYMQLNVTLDDVTVLSDHFELLEAGLLKADTPKVPTFLLADLLILAEILDDPATLLHYLWRRSSFSTELRVRADEIDILSVYLDNGLNFPIEAIDGDLILWGNSNELDPYFMGQITDQPARKPSRKMTRWWQSTVNSIVTANRARWTETACTMLNVSFEDQEAIERQHLEAFKKMRRSREKTACASFIFHNVRRHQKEVFVFVYAHGTSSESFEEDVILCAKEPFKCSGASFGIVLAFDTNVYSRNDRLRFYSVLS